MARKVADIEPDVEIGTVGFVEEFCTKPTFDEDGVQVSSGIRMDGKELPDPVPMAPPVGYTNPPDLMEMMRQMVRSEMYQRRLDEEGFDTMDEAGDFDIDDDPLPPLTMHELIMQTPAEPSGVSPSPVAASPQVETAKEGGEEAGSPNKPAPAAPSAVPPQNSTST